MAHYVLIEDAAGELVDVAVMCSDACARQHDAYAGWHGCNELEFDTPCAQCGATVRGVEGEYAA